MPQVDLICFGEIHQGTIHCAQQA